MKSKYSTGICVTSVAQLVNSKKGKFSFSRNGKHLLVQTSALCSPCTKRSKLLTRWSFRPSIGVWKPWATKSFELPGKKFYLVREIREFIKTSSKGKKSNTKISELATLKLIKCNILVWKRWAKAEKTMHRYTSKKTRWHHNNLPPCSKRGPIAHCGLSAHATCLKIVTRSIFSEILFENIRRNVTVDQNEY